MTRAERLRRAVLLIAAAVPAWYLFLLLGSLPMLAGVPPLGEGEEGRLLALLVMLGFGVLGAVALWLPLRAMRCATRGTGVALIALALTYSVLVAPGLLDVGGSPRDATGWSGGFSTWLVVPLIFGLIATGGLVQQPVVPAVIYVLALLLGGALTLRAAGVDGGGDRR